MREFESQGTELRSEDIAPVEGIGDGGKPVDLGRHIDGMTVAGAQCPLELGLWPRRPSLPSVRIAGSCQ